MKILDLFAGTQSVKKAFPNSEYKGVDIYSPEGENIILDLSQDNIIEKLLEKLGGWTPDVIWASPLCTTFSRATCIKGGTLSYELDKDKKIHIRKNFSQITHKAYIKHKDNPEWQKIQQQKGELGVNLLNNTKKIVDFFNVPFVIENPANALSQYMLTEYTRNLTAYCQYGFPYKKATAIYSSRKINLLKCNHKNHEQVMSGWSKKTGIKSAPNSNKDRSAVPPKLIKNIIEQLLEKGVLNEK